jgi:regulation of enolase protein 1 (concanavalin A-like superfamily)
VGAPLLSGTASFGDGAFSVSGAGANPLGTADQLMFVYRQFVGDGEITARVASLSGIQIGAEVGVMIRESLAPGSKHAFVRLSGAGTVALKSRSITNGNQSGTSEAGSGAPVWLRLARSASMLNAFRSADGVSWVPIGTVAIPMSPSVYVGLAVTSGTAATHVTAGFDNVYLSPTVSLTAPAEGATYTAPATVTVSATASDTDGTVTTVEFYAGTTLIGSDTTSPYSVTWSNVPAGTYSLTAKARDDVGATRISAARTITVTPPNQPPAVSLTTPANGATYTAPATIAINATASDGDGTVATVEFYAGATLIGSDTTSPYDVTWTSVPAGIYSLTAVARDDKGAAATSADVNVTVAAANQVPTVSLTAPASGATYTAPATVTVSATASDGDGTVTTVEFFAGATLIGSDTTTPYSVTWSNVPAGSYSLTAVARDDDSATTTAAPRSITVTASGLPAGWTAADIGAPATAGSTQYASGTFTVEGAGVDVWDRSDQFRYVYQAFTGDVEITSRVVSLENTDEWAKAGVMIRETLAADAAHTSLVVTPAHGTHFYRRLTPGDVTQPGPVGAVGAPAWVRLVRQGSTVTGFQSNDGVTWTAVGTATLAPATLYVGLEVTSHDPAQAATAVFDSVTVRVPSPNQPPTVSLTAPANGATFTAPATITVSATASDAAGTVTTVEFYAGATLIGADTTSPYSVTWNNVPAGSYALTAVARDNGSATTTSAARSITVTSATNQPPSVSLTAPANGATFTAPATMTVSATASDGDGTITVVEFYRGGTIQIGSDATSPYSVTWSNVPAGSYALTAVARDNASGMTVSSTRTITVNDPAAPLRAVFNASADHNSNVDYYVVEIFPAGADPENANAVAAQNIGKPAVAGGECEADVRAMIQSLSPGDYIATVTAFNGDGSARSAASAPFTR